MQKTIVLFFISWYNIDRGEDMDRVTITFKDGTHKKHDAEFLQIQGTMLLIKTTKGCHMYNIDTIKEVYNSGVPNTINFDK